LALMTRYFLSRVTNCFISFLRRFDAYRVVSGVDIEEGQIVDPKEVLVGTKLAELLGESIPGENCVI
jgi:hypothetical protein